MEMTRKAHWENVYQTKGPEEVSWTQETPTISLQVIHSMRLKKTAQIIDVGGGDSKLVDCLLAEGFENITVLDISAAALKRAQERLGGLAQKVQWIESDILDFEPQGTYELWHDRAAFHFLTRKEQIQQYITKATQAVSGNLILGTFSTQGPKKCSGLEIAQYDEDSLSAIIGDSFEKTNCITEDHITPFQTTQHFLFCSFKRNKEQ